MWPPGVVGSITHAAGWAIAVTAWRSDVMAVGIDLEGAGPLDADLVELVCGPGDREPDRRLAERGIDSGKLSFVAKEAWYKAVFPEQRRFFEFGEVETDVDAVRGYFTVCQARVEGSNAAPQRFPGAGHFARFDELLCALFLGR